MEEKEIIFKLKKDDEYMEVSSSLDDNIGYLENEEIMAVMMELLSCAIDNITKDTLEKNNIQTIEDLDIEKFLSNLSIVDKKVGTFIRELIYLLLNYFYNNNILENQKLDNIDYSLIIYGSEKNSKIRDVYKTFHHNVSENEKVLGLFAICKDIINTLLKSKSKDEVKNIFNQIIVVTSLKIYKYIDKSN